MSSAAARAEARRKAILARGNDRLAKLTTSSGRTEDLIAPSTNAADFPDPPIPELDGSAAPRLGAFVGEETPGMSLPSTPRKRVVSRASTVGSDRSSPAPPDFLGMGNGADPSAWNAEQQAQFLQALMGGGPPGEGNNPFGGGNPLAALMSAAAAGAGEGNAVGAVPGGPFGPGPGAGKLPEVAPPKTLLQRVLPAVHVLAVWALVLYFVLVREPAMHEHADVAGSGFAWRWKRLANNDRAAYAGSPIAWGVQLVPFFWAFITLELVLHSLRIFSGFDAFRPPTLLALVMPSLPAPIPSIIVHGMKYFQMGSMMLDDIAAVVFALGLVVFVASWA